MLASGKNHYKILPTIDNYANAIGLAFQLQDDILDVVDKTSFLDKRPGKNQKLCNITYPALIGLKNTQRNLLNLYQEALDALSILESKYFNTGSLKEVASFIIKRNI